MITTRHENKRCRLMLPCWLLLALSFLDQIEDFANKIQYYNERMHLRLAIQGINVVVT